MEEESGTGDGDGKAGNREQINQAHNQNEANDRAGEIDFLNASDIGMQTRHDAEYVDRKLNGKTGEDKRDQQQSINRGCAVPGEHRVQNWRDDNDRDQCEFFAHCETGIDQLTETMSILPNAAAD